MSGFTEPTRLVAHVMLDGVIAKFGEPDADDLVFAALASIPDAVPFTVDDGGDAQIDLKPMLNAAVFSIGALALRLADATGQPLEAVIARLREDVDG